MATADDGGGRGDSSSGGSSTTASKHRGSSSSTCKTSNSNNASKKRKDPPPPTLSGLATDGLHVEYTVADLKSSDFDTTTNALLSAFKSRKVVILRKAVPPAGATHFLESCIPLTSFTRPNDYLTMKVGRRSLDAVLSASRTYANGKLLSSQPDGFELVGMCVCHPECGHEGGKEDTCPGLNWGVNVFERIMSIPVIGVWLVQALHPNSKDGGVVETRRRTHQPGPFSFGPATWSAVFTGFHMDTDGNGRYMSSTSFLTGTVYGAQVKEVLWVPAGEDAETFVSALNSGSFHASSQRCKFDVKARAQNQDPNKTNFFTPTREGKVARAALQRQSIRFGYTTLGVGDVVIFPPRSGVVVILLCPYCKLFNPVFLLCSRIQGLCTVLTTSVGTTTVRLALGSTRTGWRRTRGRRRAP